MIDKRIVANGCKILSDIKAPKHASDRPQLQVWQTVSTDSKIITCSHKERVRREHIADATSTRTGQCYALPTYIVYKEGNYKCKLWQPNWASETMFELTFKHCQEIPTINLFVRNFYGADEINTDFNTKFTKWRFTLYTGKDAQFIIKFQKIKGSRTYGIRPQVRVLVAFKPNYLKSETQQLLTGVFFTDKKDDCSFFEKMGLHEQILMGMALVAALVIIPLIAFVIFRWKRDEKKMRKRRGTKKNTPCYVWFFKCDQTSSHEAYNYRYEEESELNDRAQNGRAHNGHAHNDHAHNGRAHNGHLHNGHV
eukprot:gene1087-428_t